MSEAVFTRRSSALEMRNYLGLDQAGMAWALGVDQGTVSRWESGKTPTPKWLYLAVKGMRFTHSGCYACYCAQCSTQRATHGLGGWDRE